MKYLLDTHVLLWLLENDSLIPAETLSNLKKPANRLSVSIVSIWEIAIKQSSGKLSLTRSLSERSIIVSKDSFFPLYPVLIQWN